MYHFIDDQEFLGKMHRVCADVVNQLVQNINRENVMKVKQHLVGSGAKNLILQNENQPVDLDYNLEILTCNNQDDWNNCKSLKEYIMKKFNEVLKSKGWGDCGDSTSVLTTNRMHFTKGNDTEWRIDLAITCRCRDGHWERLIHNKTGFTYCDSWVWQIAPDSKGFEKRVEKLKKANKWIEVRQRYFKKKNMYLSRQEENNHPSFNVYIETINEIY